jgi:Xaa-Pro aminopeptidase
MFDSQIYLKRRNELVKSLKDGFILFCGNNEVPMNYQSNYYPFVQDSSFLYYCGIDFPNLNLLINTYENSATLYGSNQSVNDIIWCGQSKTLNELAKLAHIDQISNHNNFQKDIDLILSQDEILHILPQYRYHNKQILSEIFGGGKWENYISADLIKSVISQRSIKSELEVDEIKNAMVVTKSMHEMAMINTKFGKTEQEIVGELMSLVHSTGMRLAYPSIFTVRGEILHNQFYEGILQDGQLLLHDGGVESREHYATDITRTYPVTGRFLLEQRAIYEIVLKMQVDVIRTLSTGVKYRDMHLLASKICIEGLKSMGIMKGNTEDAIRSGAHALFFPHGLGHMLGLDVHDMEALGEDNVGYDSEILRDSQFGLSYLRLGKTLQCGNVITVEPGIYFIPALIDQWEQKGRHKEFVNYSSLNSFRDFGGIRIEDDVLITNDGCDCLSYDIPKNISEIEQIMGNASV